MSKWFLDKTCKKDLNRKSELKVLHIQISLLLRGGRGGRGARKLKIWYPGLGGGNFIWYAKIEYKEAEVIWIANDWQNTSSSSVRSSNTSTNSRSLLRNEVNNWQEVGFFLLTYKRKHRVGFFARTCKTKHNTDGSLLLWDRKKVSVSISFQTRVENFPQ